MNTPNWFWDKSSTTRARIFPNAWGRILEWDPERSTFSTYTHSPLSSKSQPLLRSPLHRFSIGLDKPLFGGGNRWGSFSGRKKHCEEEFEETKMENWGKNNKAEIHTLWWFLLLTAVSGLPWRIGVQKNPFMTLIEVAIFSFLFGCNKFNFCDILVFLKYRFAH